MGRKDKKRRDAQGDDEAFAAVNPFGALNLDLPPGDPALESPEPEAVDSTAGAALHVRFERKGRGGKTVTLIDGFPPDSHADDLDRLARDLRQTLSIGGTVRDQAIELQGDVVARAAAHLRTLGYTVKGA